jgi:hypothetical protein
VATALDPVEVQQVGTWVLTVHFSMVIAARTLLWMAHYPVAVVQDTDVVMDVCVTLQARVAVHLV